MQMNPFLMQALYHMMQGQQGMQGVNRMPYVYGGYTGQQQQNAAPLYQPAAAQPPAPVAPPVANQDPYHVARERQNGPAVGGMPAGNPLFAPNTGRAAQNVGGLLSVAPQSPWNPLFRQAR